MKYKLTEQTKQIGGITLYQIQAIESFGVVEAGDLGGWIEKESNLSQEDNCWVFSNAKVYGGAKVYSGAVVSGHAEVYGNAGVSGQAYIYGYTHVYMEAKVYGGAWEDYNIFTMFTAGSQTQQYIKQ